MKFRRMVCLLIAVVMVMAMSTATASAASFKTKPTGVKATCVSGVSVKVSCKKKAGATGYKFYYATKKSGKYKLGATSKTRTATIKGLTAGKTYYFKVKAYKGKALKTYTKMSKPAKCKTVLKAPAVKITDKCDCKVYFQLSTKAGAKGYQIYRSTNKTSGFTKVKTISSKSDAVWNDKDLKGSTTYYYKVRYYSGSYHSPFSAVKTVKTLPYQNGNDSKYDPTGSLALSLADPDAKAALNERTIFFLGSSITYGSATKGVSFADYIRARDGATVYKEAVSGTTMSKTSVMPGKSYVERLTNNGWAEGISPDVFACQLSLNDSLTANKVDLGTDADLVLNFDQLEGEHADDYLAALYEQADTVAGSIRYITAFAYRYWPDCQVVFYTVRDNGYNTVYPKMRTMLFKARKTYGTYDLSYGDDGTGYKNRNRIEIIDMFSNSELTNLNAKYYCLYMNDANHPKKAGYLYQWTPAFEEALIQFMTPLDPSAIQDDSSNGGGGTSDSDAANGGAAGTDNDQGTEGTDPNESGQDEETPGSEPATEDNSEGDSNPGEDNTTNTTGLLIFIQAA